MTRPEGSGTVAALDAGVHAIGKKIVEEAAEVWMAAEHEGKDRAAEEISQLLYHLQVLMVASRHLPSTTSTPTSERRHRSMLRIAVPNKGSLSEPAVEMLRESGYRVASRRQGARPHRRRQRRRVLLPAPARHRGLRRLGHPRLSGSPAATCCSTPAAPPSEVMPARLRRLHLPVAAAPGTCASVADIAGTRVATSYPGSWRAPAPSAA